MLPRKDLLEKRYAFTHTDCDVLADYLLVEKPLDFVGLDSNQQLVVNPRLVVWPGDSIHWLLLDGQGRPGTPFLLPSTAMEVLEAFLSPNTAAAVFPTISSEVKAALDACVRDGVLLPLHDPDMPDTDRSLGLEWSGFRVRDHLKARRDVDWRSLETRRHILSEKRIQVLDGCLDEAWMLAVHRWLFQLAYRQIDSDTRHTKYSRHWVNSMVPAGEFATVVPLFSRLVTLAVAASETSSVTLKRIDAYM